MTTYYNIWYFKANNESKKLVKQIVYSFICKGFVTISAWGNSPIFA